jgi:hypothetical protein
MVHICLLTAPHFLRWLTQSRKRFTRLKIESMPVRACSHNLFAAYEHELLPVVSRTLAGLERTCEYMETRFLFKTHEV